MCFSAWKHQKRIRMWGAAKMALDHTFLIVEHLWSQSTSCSSLRGFFFTVPVRPEVLRQFCCRTSFVLGYLKRWCFRQFDILCLVQICVAVHFISCHLDEVWNRDFRTRSKKNYKTKLLTNACFIHRTLDII
jgi:hypothetical protein